MTPDAEAVAKEIVWKWANQFSYKLNISDTKIEELNRQVIDALTTFTDQQVETLGRNRVQSTLDNWKATVNINFTERDFYVMQQLIDHAFQQPSRAQEGT